MTSLNLFLFVFGALLTSNSIAQTLYQTRINDVNLSQVLETSEGQYIAVGWNFGDFIPEEGHIVNEGTVLLKTNPEGDTLWSRIYSVNAPDDFSLAHSLTLTLDGGYLIAGGCYECHNTGGLNLLLIHTDENGDTIWTRKYGGEGIDMARSIIRTLDGHYIIVGETTSFGNDEVGMYVLKVNIDGMVIWSKKITSAQTCRAFSVLENEDGNIVLAGVTNEFGGEPDIILVSLNADGEFLWTKTFGGDKYEFGYDMCPAVEGGYAIVGASSSYGSGSADICLIITDEHGNPLNTKVYGGNLGETGETIMRTSDDHYVIGGHTNSIVEKEGAYYLLKTNAEGNRIWSKGYLVDYGGFAKDILETSNGLYLTAGYEFELMKLKTDGTTSCIHSTLDMVEMQILMGIINNPVNVVDVNTEVRPSYIKILNGLQSVNSCVTVNTNLPMHQEWVRLKTNLINDKIYCEIKDGVPENVSIVNGTGNELYRIGLEADKVEFELDASGLVPGMYFLRVTLTDGYSIHKFIKY